MKTKLSNLVVLAVLVIMSLLSTGCSDLVTGMKDTNRAGSRTSYTAKQCGEMYPGDAEAQARCVFGY